jgi:hypothetical protein
MKRRIGGVEHKGSGKPVYSLIVDQRPSAGSKLGKAAYKDAVQEVARRGIHAPLTGDDIEVEILYSCRSPAGIVIDLDNVSHPTPNALTGIAYRDDRQVRSLRAARFEPKMPMYVRGSWFALDAIFFQESPRSASE